MIKAIIFDCFGVTIASSYLRHMAELKQRDTELADSIRGMNRAMDEGILSRDEFVIKAAEAFGMTVEEFETEGDKKEVRNVELIDYARSLKNEYKVALLSNVNSRTYLERRFLPGELDEVFDAVVASGDVNMVKPEPQIYTYTTDRLDVQPEECIMVDDVQEFCDGASSVGIHAIRFESNEQVKREIALLIDQNQ